MSDRDEPGRPPKGWHSRGYLPHCDFSGLVQGVTFRLHDAVPAAVIAQWKRDLHWLEEKAPEGEGHDVWEEQREALHRRLAAYEDAGHGACHLRTEAIANLTAAALRHFDGERYSLHAWCIMPNHVHALFRPAPGCRTGDILHSWKRHTARQANLLLGTEGAFWAPDYYDRYIRDEVHYWRAVHYIHNNPVKAGLCASAEKWRWSSAFRSADL